MNVTLLQYLGCEGLIRRPEGGGVGVGVGWGWGGVNESR
jgi:hypothetical protein